jgi:hypothetical protein
MHITRAAGRRRGQKGIPGIVHEEREIERERERERETAKGGERSEKEKRAELADEGGSIGTLDREMSARTGAWYSSRVFCRPSSCPSAAPSEVTRGDRGMELPRID